MGGATFLSVVSVALSRSSRRDRSRLLTVRVELTSSRYAPYTAPPSAPSTPVRTGFILTSPTTGVKGKHLLLVSTDMAEKMRRGGVIQFQSGDGKEYQARHAGEPDLAERTAYFSQLGAGAAGKKFVYQAADEGMDVDDYSSPASMSSVGRYTQHGLERYTPVHCSPPPPSVSQVDAVAAAAAEVIERERALRERERMLAIREREMAERQHILQYEREYEQVYEERMRHLAAHPYHPRYADREVDRLRRQRAPLWNPRTDGRIERGDRHSIVYAIRPPRSVTPRGPSRSCSR